MPKPDKQSLVSEIVPIKFNLYELSKLYFRTAEFLMISRQAT